MENLKANSILQIASIYLMLDIVDVIKKKKIMFRYLKLDNRCTQCVRELLEARTDYNVVRVWYVPVHVIWDVYRSRRINLALPGPEIYL